MRYFYDYIFFPIIKRLFSNILLLPLIWLIQQLSNSEFQTQRRGMVIDKHFKKQKYMYM